jgi:hypothetical protein
MPNQQWIETRCEDTECRATHAQLIDGDTGEVLGLASGPLWPLPHYQASTKGEHTGHYIDMRAAQRAIERTLEEQRQEKRARADLLNQANRLTSPETLADVIGRINESGAFRLMNREQE